MWFVAAHSIVPLLVMTVIALAFGWHLVASIGGGDMPVVVSMLNSYSGWAAAAAGFMLGNDLLIVTGALVGSSGAYLSYIMCTGDEPVVRLGHRRRVRLRRSGRRLATSTTASTARRTRPRSPTCSRTPSSVVITPGYGMAVAQAQYPVAELTRKLRERGRRRAVRHPPGRGPAARAT